jgi:hypothetical protein
MLDDIRPLLRRAFYLHMYVGFSIFIFYLNTLDGCRENAKRILEEQEKERIRKEKEKEKLLKQRKNSTPNSTPKSNNRKIVLEKNYDNQKQNVVKKTPNKNKI